MEKLKWLICYFMKNCMGELGRTELVKLIYWFEYLRVQTFGKQLTEVKFIRYNYGPYIPEINSILEEMESVGIMNIQKYEYGDGKCTYLHSIKNINTLEEFMNSIFISNEDKIIADVTIKDLDVLPYDKMIDKVYSTPPMAKLLSEEDISGKKLKGEELNMKESSPIYKTSKKKLLAAKRRMLSRKDKGTDEDYILCLQEERESYEPLVRRANYVRNKL